MLCHVPPAVWYSDCEGGVSVCDQDFIALVDIETRGLITSFFSKDSAQYFLQLNRLPNSLSARAITASCFDLMAKVIDRSINVSL